MLRQKKETLMTISCFMIESFEMVFFVLELDGSCSIVCSFKRIIQIIAFKICFFRVIMNRSFSLKNKDHQFDRLCYITCLYVVYTVICVMSNLMDLTIGEQSQFVKFNLNKSKVSLNKRSRECFLLFSHVDYEEQLNVLSIYTVLKTRN